MLLVAMAQKKMFNFIGKSIGQGPIFHISLYLFYHKCIVSIFLKRKSTFYVLHTHYKIILKNTYEKAILVSNIHTLDCNIHLFSIVNILYNN